MVEDELVAVERGPPYVLDYSGDVAAAIVHQLGDVLPLGGVRLAGQAGEVEVVHLVDRRHAAVVDHRRQQAPLVDAGGSAHHFAVEHHQGLRDAAVAGGG